MSRISEFGLRYQGPSSGGAVQSWRGFLVGAHSLNGDGGAFLLVGALLFGRAVDDASSLFDGDVKINNVVLLIWVRKRTIGNGT